MSEETGLSLKLTGYLGIIIEERAVCQGIAINQANFTVHEKAQANNCVACYWPEIEKFLIEHLNKGIKQLCQENKIRPNTQEFDFDFHIQFFLKTLSQDKEIGCGLIGIHFGHSSFCQYCYGPEEDCDFPEMSLLQLPSHLMSLTHYHILEHCSECSLECAWSQLNLAEIVENFLSETLK